MFNKFLDKINNASSVMSIEQKVADYNKEVLDKKSTQQVNHVPIFLDNIHYYNKPSSYNKHSKFEKTGSQFSKSPANTIENIEKPTFKKNTQFVDDGSYFCSYCMGGHTLVCYKGQNKIELVLEGIHHPDKDHYLAKQANYFLNDLLKKKKVYVTKKDNGFYDIYLDPQKQNSINQILMNEGFHTSEKQTDLSSALPTNLPKKDTSNSEIKEKKNYAYGLFAINHNTFEALFNNNKILLTLFNVDIDFISKEDQKLCKSIIYDFVSKKSIILQFHKEENGVHFVDVFNKEGQSLNDIIISKKFQNIKPVVSNVSENTHIENNVNNDSCSENDWDWVNDNNDENHVQQESNLPAMFKKDLISKPNSPFAKKKSQDASINYHNQEPILVENFGEEKNVPDVINLPAMFKKDLISKPNSPFGKHKSNKEDNNNIHKIPPVVTNKTSFGKR